MHTKSVSLSILTYLVLIISLVSLTGHFAHTHWVIDMISHFKIQYMILIGILIIPLAIFKKIKIIIVILLILFVNLYNVYPLWVSHDHLKPEKAYENSLSLTSINVLSTNQNYQEICDYIQSKNPDIIAIQEMTFSLESILDTVLSDYPYRQVVSRHDNFGIALYSKVKTQKLKILSLGEADLPSISMTVNINYSNLEILVTHPVPPIGNQGFTLRNDQFNALSDYINSSRNEFILVGDLNCSSFSSSFQNLLFRTNLMDSRQGFGVLPTWPSWLPMMYTTLDHILVSKSLRVTNREVGKDIGSDHLPILVELFF